MKKVNFINSYSFIFSSRPGTPSSGLSKIDDKIAKERLLIFQNIADEIKKDYRKQLVNSIVNVLFENNVKDSNKFFGRDEYFNSVIVESHENLTGQIRKIKIQDCSQNTLFGEIISKEKQKDFAA